MISSLNHCTLDKSTNVDNSLPNSVCSFDGLRYSVDNDPEHWSAFLKCTVCFDFFLEPRCLPCGHSFCKKCIEGIIEHARQLKFNQKCKAVVFPCPHCRYQVTGRHFYKYSPRNIVLENIIEGWLKSKERQKAKVRMSDQSSQTVPFTANHGTQTILTKDHRKSIGYQVAIDTMDGRKVQGFHQTQEELGNENVNNCKHLQPVQNFGLLNKVHSNFSSVKSNCQHGDQFDQTTSTHLDNLTDDKNTPGLGKLSLTDAQEQIIRVNATNKHMAHISTKPNGLPGPNGHRDCTDSKAPPKLTQGHTTTPPPDRYKSNHGSPSNTIASTLLGFKPALDRHFHQAAGSLDDMKDSASLQPLEDVLCSLNDHLLPGEKIETAEHKLICLAGNSPAMKENQLTQMLNELFC